MARKIETQREPAQEQALQLWLDQRPLVVSESPVTYDALQAEARAALNPSDIIERLLVKDVVDYSWEVARLRDVVAGLQNVSRIDALSKMLVMAGFNPHAAHELSVPSQRKAYVGVCRRSYSRSALRTPVSRPSQ